MKPMKTMLEKPMLHFFMIGFLLWLAQYLFLNNVTQRTITVSQARLSLLTEQWQKQSGRTPSALERKELLDAYVREEALVQTALSRKFSQVDPLIQNRLEMNLRFIGDAPEQSASPLWQKAISMGMHEQDPVVRRRLVQLMERNISDGFSPPTPSDDELRSYLQINHQRYRENPTWSFEHIFFSNDRFSTARQRGVNKMDAQHRAMSLLQQLKQDSKSSFKGQGDASLIPGEFREATVPQIIRYFGEPFAKAIAGLPINQWSGPVASPFGWHLVHLHQATQATQPDFDLIRDQLAQDWLNEKFKAYQKSAEHEIIKRYDVVYP